MQIQKINRGVSLKFSIVIKNDSADPKLQTISTSLFNGNLYTRLSPYPNLIIDLGNELRERGGTWNANSQILLDPLHAYRFAKRGRSLLKSFVERKDLFLYEGNVLTLNQTAAKECEVVIPCEFSKTTYIKPVVIRDYDMNVECEGVMLMVNDVSNFATLSFEEFEFLIYTIGRLDFASTTASIMNMYMTYLSKMDTNVNN